MEIACLVIYKIIQKSLLPAIISKTDDSVFFNMIIFILVLLTGTSYFDLQTGATWLRMICFILSFTIFELKW